jgi:uncharacterized protein (DUF305 family)
VRSSVTRVVILVTSVALLAGCTSPPTALPRPTSTAPVVQLGAPGEPNRTLSPDEQLVINETPHTEADAQFIRDMMHHHAQALTMTGFVPDRSDSRDVNLLAERMQISQEDELILMEEWLQQRGEPARDPDGDHGHAGMPGLLTDAEIAQLEAASGEEFDRLFLEFMIRHHLGAITMVDEHYAAGGGDEPNLGAMMRHIDGDQRIEIARMEQMLADLG